MESKVTKNENSEVEIEVKLETDEILKHKSDSLKRLGKDIELPGFRKGKAPAEMLEEKISKEMLFRDMAEMAVNETYPKIISEHKVSPLGRPNVTITKLASGNPLEFKITTPVMPEVTLPDYKAIAETHNKKSPEKVAVEEKELNEAIKNIREYHKQDATKNFTDEDVKAIGEFKDVADFKSKIQSQIETQKKMMAGEKRKIALVEEIIKETKVTVPEILIQAEIGKMLARFKADVDKAGMKFEEYLEQIKKSEEQLVKEWRPDAEKQAKLQLILNRIASEEKVVPDKERVEKELEHLLEHQKDADKEMARIYIYTVLMNEKVFEWLESIGKTPKKEEASN